MKSTDLYALARARALVTVYDEVWSAKLSEYEIIEAEREFTFPLLNPETEAASRTFDEAGKIDVLARHKPTNQLVVFEHKTTSDGIEPQSNYWDRLRLDPQCSKYFLAAMQQGKDAKALIYDVVSKPAHRPSLIPEIDKEGFKVVKDAAGNRIFLANGKKPRETGDAEKGWVVQGRQENPTEFETRLLSVLRAEPGSYFAQREVPRLDSDILEYMNDAWSLSQQILYFRQRKIWPRNPNSCTMYGTCEFFDICCGRASVDGIRFAKRDKVHTELKIQGADKELLTNSRLNALRKCARFHQLRYEERVEKVGEVSEALSFGTLFHAGLEAYFNFLKVNQSN